MHKKTHKARKRDLKQGCFSALSFFKKYWGWILVILIAAVDVLFLTVDLLFDLKALLVHNDFTYEFIKASCTTATVSLILALITTYFAEKILSAQKNDSRLKKIGVEEVDLRVVSAKDEKDMFGRPRRNEFPIRLDLMFFTGKSFLTRYKKQLLDALINGCEVRLLLVDPYLQKKDGSIIENGFVSRFRDLNKIAEEIRAVQQPLQEIQEEAAALNAKGKFEVRYYIDEYMYSYECSTYEQDDLENAHVWVNFHSFTTCPINNSLLLKGSLELSNRSKDDSKDDEGLMRACYDSFHLLWERYEGVTAPTLPKEKTNE